MRNFIAIPSILALTLAVSANGAWGAVYKVPGDFATIGEAIAKSRSGDTVIVAPGTYYEHLELKPGVVLRAKGTVQERRNHITARRTIIHGKKGVKKTVVEGADGAVLDGFTLTGLDKVDHHQPGHPHGIQCRGTSSIIINNIVHHMGSTGIGNHAGKNGERSAPYIANNIVYANYGLGIGCNHNSSPTIVGNIIYSNEELGIGVKNGAHPLIERNTVFNNNFMGIGTKDGAYAAIINNISHNNGKAKIIHKGAGISSRNTFTPLIAGNRIYKNAFVGVGLTSGASTTVRENYIYANGISGIAIREHATAKVENNRVFSHPMGGIRLMGPGVSVLINNTIYNNGMGGIIHMMGPPAMRSHSTTDEKATLIQGNEIFKNEGGGISSFGTGKKVILKNNHVYSNRTLLPDPTRMFKAPGGLVPPSHNQGQGHIL